MKQLIILLFIVLLFGCSGGNLAGGSSSETTTGVVVISSAGTLYGKAESESSLFLCSNDYNPLVKEGFEKSISVSDDETFSFNNLDGGSYNLYAWNDLSAGKLLISSILVNNGETRNYNAQFESGGNVTGKFDVVIGESDTVGLLGSPFTAEINSAGEFFFKDIPVGTYSLLDNLYENVVDSETVNISSSTITVVSDSTVTWEK